jgi:hypothetical protein
MITLGKRIIYRNSDTEDELKKRKLYDILKDNGNISKILEGKAIFDMVVYDNNGIPVITPPVIYNYKY